MQLLRLCRAAPRSHLHNTLPSRPESLPWQRGNPPARLRHRHRRRASVLVCCAAGCFSQAHARHGLERLVVLGQRRCAAACFPLHNTITPGPAPTGDAR